MNDLLLFLGIWVIIYVVYQYFNVIETYEDPMTIAIQAKLVQVDPRAALLSISASDQSFTEDKHRTYLCLKDKNGKYYDDNMLMYVALHELAHAISKQTDPNHTTSEFRENFQQLLDKAAVLKLYDPQIPIDYSYCPAPPRK
jgi:hypothetical protein